MYKQAVLMFPAFKGNGVINVSDKLVKLSKDFFLVPILNGLPEGELKKIAREALPIFDPVIVDSSARGLVDALIGGYKYVIEHYNEALIVRADIEEHPIWLAEPLSEKVKGTRGMIIRDLSFYVPRIIVNPIDKMLHEEVFPALYGSLTKGRLTMSGAHGFQFFDKGVCQKILPGAMEILKAVKSRGGTIIWGFDLIMALAAIAAGIEVDVGGVPAIMDRDRSNDKVWGQFEDHVRILKTATQVFPNLYQ